MSLLLLLVAPAAAPTPTPTPTQEAGSPWGPWQPIRVRPLIRGSVHHTLRPLVATVTGTVLDNEDWLLGIPTDT